MLCTSPESAYPSRLGSAPGPLGLPDSWPRGGRGCAPCLMAIVGKPHNAIMNRPQTLRRVKESKCKELLNFPQEAEAQDSVAVAAAAGDLADAIRRPAVPGAAEPATATVDPVRA